jgi:23S rRNA pseudouridine955/2504/2580 synthase
MIQSLYESDEILILDKPAGLPVQPGEGVRVTLIDAVERDYGFRPYLVHRLDKETAGLIIVAKDSRSASLWTRAIEQKSLRKFYRAVVAGGPEGSSGVMRAPVRVRGEAMAAETKWRLLGRFGASGVGGPADSAVPAGFSYLELELGTGRTHQIRLHLAESGSPILGDDRHGDFGLNKALRKSHGLKRLLLLSRRLVLPNGAAVTAPVPDYFRDFLGAFPGAPDPELE